MENVLLNLDKIRQTYGDQEVVKDLSLTLERGKIGCLLGSSGCGKTTVLRCIAGFEAPDSGVTFVASEAVNALPVENRPVGFIFQRHALFPHMNVYDNIAVGPRTRKMPEKEIDLQVTEMLRILKLTSKRNGLPLQISGGESQRVALARALAPRPRVMLMDEPFSALDALTREEMGFELQKIWMEKPKTVLFITHSISEAVLLADKVLVMGPRPSTVLEEINIDLPRPRDIHTLQDPTFGAYTNKIREYFYRSEKKNETDRKDKDNVAPIRRTVA